jgi:hypothetical protein
VVHQSYFFNATDNRNNQSLRRQYVASQDSVALYNEQSNSESKNYNHRIDSRIEYTIDSANSLIVQPRLYFQNNNTSSSLTGVNSLSTMQFVNQAKNDNHSNSSGNNLSMESTYRHRFGTPGRTVSLTLRASTNHKRGSGDLRSLAEYALTPANAGDALSQQSTALTDGSSVSSRLAYTEPIADNSLLQITYNPSFSKNSSDTRKYNFDALTQQYSDLDSDLSNTFDNTYSTHSAGVGYRLKGSGFNVMTDVSYQIATLRGEQTFPLGGTVSRTFHNLLPSATANFNFGDQGNLRLLYRTSTREPSIGQLQDVVDNSNPLLLSTGNPNLRQSYTHSFVSRYSLTTAEKARSFFALFSLSSANDYIANSTLTAARDTALPGGTLLKRGTQLTSPVNANGYWNLRSFLTYGLPVNIIMANVNLNTGFTYSRTPGIIDGLVNLANTYVVSAGVVVGSNISEDVDFTLSYGGNYNISRNTLEPELNNKYYNHTTSVKLNLIFWEGIVFRGEMSNILYSGLSATFDKNYTLLNISLAKKLLENQRGEIRVGVTDLLDQNKSINRTVTETYTEDSENQILGRYFMLILTYTLR